MSDTQDTPRQDYDSPWKEILSEYFQEFMTFFFPNESHEIDWSRRYVLLDKEFRQITRNAKIGKRIADQLVKVWTIILQVWSGFGMIFDKPKIKYIRVLLYSNKTRNFGKTKIGS